MKLTVAICSLAVLATALPQPKNPNFGEPQLGEGQHRKPHGHMVRDIKDAKFGQPVIPRYIPPDEYYRRDTDIADAESRGRQGGSSGSGHGDGKPKNPKLGLPAIQSYIPPKEYYRRGNGDPQLGESPSKGDPALGQGTQGPHPRYDLPPPYERGRHPPRDIKKPRVCLHGEGCQ